MKILFLVAEHGYSFMNQAQALVPGFRSLKIVTKVVKIYNNTLPAKTIRTFHPDGIVSVGSWGNFPLLVGAPAQLGYAVLPWLVTDDRAEQYIQHYKKLPCIATPSVVCKNIMFKAGLSLQRIAVIPEAVNADLWQPLPKKELDQFLEMVSVSEIDPSLVLPFSYDLRTLRAKKVPIIYTTGGSATGKGAQEVIRALGKIGQKMPWLYMIKSWPAENSLQHAREELHLAQRLGILEHIRYFSGVFSQQFMRGMMNLCDIYAAPAPYEGFGLPVVEAQMCGKPVIALRGTSPEETIVHGKTGFLVRPQRTLQSPRANVDDLAKYLRILLTQSAKRKQMSQAAAAHARKHFHPRVIAQRMLKLLTSVVSY